MDSDWRGGGSEGLRPQRPDAERDGEDCEACPTQNPREAGAVVVGGRWQAAAAERGARCGLRHGDRVVALGDHRLVSSGSSPARISGAGVGEAV
jgi:hypothetical protein